MKPRMMLIAAQFGLLVPIAALVLLVALLAGCAAPSLVCNVRDGKAQVVSKVASSLVTSEPLKDADAYCADLMGVPEEAPAPKAKRK